MVAAEITTGCSWLIFLVNYVDIVDVSCILLEGMVVLEDRILTSFSLCIPSII